jgi:hypothetical protein
MGLGGARRTDSAVCVRQELDGQPMGLIDMEEVYRVTASEGRVRP